MEMIWHDYKFAQRNIRKMCRYLLKHRFNHYSHLIQDHFSIDYLPKIRFAIMGYNCDKPGTWLRIIIIR